MNEKINYPILIGKMDMSLEEHYDGYLNEKNKYKYSLCATLTRLIDKYPPTTSKFKEALNKLNNI